MFWTTKLCSCLLFILLSFYSIPLDYYYKAKQKTPTKHQRTQIKAKPARTPSQRHYSKKFNHMIQSKKFTHHQTECISQFIFNKAKHIYSLCMTKKLNEKDILEHFFLKKDSFDIEVWWSFGLPFLKIFCRWYLFDSM